jgi:hypothetical protein
MSSIQIWALGLPFIEVFGWGPRAGAGLYLYVLWFDQKLEFVRIWLNGEESWMQWVPPELGSGLRSTGAGRPMRHEADQGSMRCCVTMADGGGWWWSLSTVLSGLRTGLSRVGDPVRRQQLVGYTRSTGLRTGIKELGLAGCYGAWCWEEMKR